MDQNPLIEKPYGGPIDFIYVQLGHIEIEGKWIGAKKSG